jgi:hypothetical protein
MEPNRFTKCEKSLVENDLLAVEQALGIKLPEDLKQHYLQYNGGKPEKVLWVYPNGEYDDIEVRDFMPIRYAEKFGDDPDFTAEGTANEGWTQDTLPRNLFPIALDWGGNYFCVNHENGGVYYFIRDVWSDNLSVEKNLQVNTRFVTSSLSEFVCSLIPGEDE